ncbi:MAG: TrmH family RNA methyltransferase [Candidatus Micrarchaeota archaeon]
MEFAIVLVEPEYDLNVGMSARVMKNFGFSDLRIVKPRCEVGFDAVKYSKHAVGLLKRVKKYGTLKAAVRGCGLVVGTTGILERNKGTIRSALPLKKFCTGLGTGSWVPETGTVALLFGREGIGLNEKEIGECDLLVHAEADSGYPVLNLSHAMAVVLYSVRMASGKGKKMREGRMKPSERRALTHMFKLVAEKYKVRNPERCRVAFARVLARANPTSKEGHSLLGAFRSITENSGGHDYPKEKGGDEVPQDFARHRRSDADVPPSSWRRKR